jgi:hypothetical protein
LSSRINALVVYAFIVAAPHQATAGCAISYGKGGSKAFQSLLALVYGIVCILVALFSLLLFKLKFWGLPFLILLYYTAIRHMYMPVLSSVNHF